MCVCACVCMCVCYATYLHGNGQNTIVWTTSSWRRFWRPPDSNRSMLYHNPQAVMEVNRRHSRAFEFERSVRQGCPMSPLLYVSRFRALAL